MSAGPRLLCQKLFGSANESDPGILDQDFDPARLRLRSFDTGIDRSVVRGITTRIETSARPLPLIRRLVRTLNLAITAGFECTLIQFSCLRSIVRRSLNHDRMIVLHS
jgi:hypothetical protein